MQLGIFTVFVAIVSCCCGGIMNNLFARNPNNDNRRYSNNSNNTNSNNTNSNNTGNTFTFTSPCTFNFYVYNYFRQQDPNHDRDGGARNSNQGNANRAILSAPLIAPPPPTNVFVDRRLRNVITIISTKIWNAYVTVKGDREPVHFGEKAKMWLRRIGYKLQIKCAFACIYTFAY